MLTDQQKADAALVCSMIHDLASPEATNARRLRLVASNAARQSRLSALMQARSIRRAQRIRTPWEALTELNNLIASIDAAPGSELARMHSEILEVAATFDAELAPAEHDEVGSERAEFDVATVGVRGRA